MIEPQVLGERTLGWARTRLNVARGQSATDQSRDREEIVEAFRIYWASAPSEADFVATCSGLVWDAAMQWIMVRGARDSTPQYLVRSEPS